MCLLATDLLDNFVRQLLDNSLSHPFIYLHYTKHFYVITSLCQNVMSFYYDIIVLCCDVITLFHDIITLQYNIKMLQCVPYILMSLLYNVMLQYDTLHYIMM